MSERLRRFVYYRLGFLVRERYYDPDLVGYRSHLRAPIIGAVAFRREDGSLLFKW